MFPCLINHLSLVPRLYQLVRCITLRQLAAIITRSHDFTVSSGRAKGYKVATLHTVQIDSLAKDIGGLADRPYYIIGLLRSIGSDVLYLMECLVECGTNQIRHTCIENSKLLISALLYIQNLCNKRTALPHYRTPQFKMKCLIRTEFQAVIVGFEMPSPPPTLTCSIRI